MSGWRFLLLQVTMGTSNGMLTPTMKIRRGAIEDAAETHVDDWYTESDDVLWA